MESVYHKGVWPAKRQKIEGTIPPAACKKLLAAMVLDALANLELGKSQAILKSESFHYLTTPEQNQGTVVFDHLDVCPYKLAEKVKSGFKMPKMESVHERKEYTAKKRTRKCRTMFVKYQGRDISVKDLAELTGIKNETLYYRVAVMKLTGDEAVAYRRGHGAF